MCYIILNTRRPTLHENRFAIVQSRFGSGITNQHQLFRTHLLIFTGTIFCQVYAPTDLHRGYAFLTGNIHRKSDPHHILHTAKVAS
jgi:hypothetical protein